MLSLLLWLTVVFVLSIVNAYGSLRLRVRGIGLPFGPRSRPWAITIIMIVAMVSTGLGLALAAITHHIGPAYIGLVVPSVLWFSKFPPQRDPDMSPRRRLDVLLTLPLSRLYDRMGDDLMGWCDVRLGAASAKPQRTVDAMTYYYNQVRGQHGDDPASAKLDLLRESIIHKIGIVRLIDLGATQAQFRDSLQMHPSTGHIRSYTDDDLLQLARRLETEALSELHFVLTYVYRHASTRFRYIRLPVYTFAPPISRAQARPSSGPPPRTLYREPHSA
jgi:hypothetical protein